MPDLDMEAVAASARVRAWFRSELMKKLVAVDMSKKKPKPRDPKTYPTLVNSKVRFTEAPVTKFHTRGSKSVGEGVGI